MKTEGYYNTTISCFYIDYDNNSTTITTTTYYTTTTTTTEDL